MNSINLENRIDTIFMNSKIIEASDTHRLLPNILDKIDLEKSDKYVTLSNLSIYNTLKNIKKVIRKQ